METTTEGTEGNGLADAAKAAADARADEITEVKRSFSRVLEIPLTEHEIAERAKSMASLAKEIDDVEAKKKAIAHELGQEIKDLQGQLSGIAKEVRSGCRTDDVPCEEGLDYSEQHMLTKRLDTLEIIDRRPLNAAERQGNFSFVEGEDEGVDDDDEGPGNVVHLRTEDAELDAAALQLRNVYTREELDGLAALHGIEVIDSMTDHSVSDLLAEAGVRAEPQHGDDEDESGEE